MKIALVYDRVNKIGGAERVLVALHEMWPDAPLFTAVYNSKTARWADVFEIKTSFLQKIPFIRTRHELLAWITSFAFSKFDFSKYDVVLSITSAEAKNINCGPNTLHICYCLTPTRYLWSHKGFYETDGLKGKFLKALGPILRMRDWESAQKVNQFLAISNTIKKRIKKYYGKESEVIYPPVGVSKLPEKLENKDELLNKNIPYYLIISRLVSYKRIDLAIKACNKLNKNLIIVGFGNQIKQLKKISGPSIFFTDQLTDEEVGRYYMHCSAFLFTADEDFGIAPVEAQLYGKPVIALSKGGSTETVIDGKTGVFFNNQTVESLAKAMIRFEGINFLAANCQENGLKFSKKIFKFKIENYVNKAWEAFEQKNYVK